MISPVYTENLKPIDVQKANHGLPGRVLYIEVHI